VDAGFHSKTIQANGQQREGAAAAIDKLLQGAQLLQDQSATK
jgi:hypothetical protein